MRHSFNISAVYPLPFGAKLGGVSKILLKGGKSGSYSMRAAGCRSTCGLQRPDVVYVDAQGLVYGSSGAGRTAVINTLGGGGSRNVRRPDIIPGVDPFLYADKTIFLNPAAFTIPKPGTAGNLMRNALHGPAFRQLDFILNKKFAITEDKNVEFRAEFFNIFNMANFRQSGGDLAERIGHRDQSDPAGTAIYTGSGRNFRQNYQDR